MVKSIGCDKCNEITNASTLELLSQDLGRKVRTAYDRIESRGMSSCLFGSGGTCCRICNMGPCQIIDGVESNASGQLAQLIRRETGFEIKRRVLRYDGLPITPEYILRGMGGL